MACHVGMTATIALLSRIPAQTSRAAAIRRTVTATARSTDWIAHLSIALLAVLAGAACGSSPSDGVAPYCGGMREPPNLNHTFCGDSFCNGEEQCCRLDYVIDGSPGCARYMCRPRSADVSDCFGVSQCDGDPGDCPDGMVCCAGALPLLSVCRPPGDPLCAEPVCNSDHACTGTLPYCVDIGVLEVRRVCVAERP
jgi:hypothetical protein